MNIDVDYMFKGGTEMESPWPGDRYRRDGTYQLGGMYVGGLA